MINLEFRSQGNNLYIAQYGSVGDRWNIKLIGDGNGIFGLEVTKFNDPSFEFYCLLEDEYPEVKKKANAQFTEILEMSIDEEE